VEKKMNKANIQIRGNCQCCGNDQAVVRGYASKHGYTVNNGWFNGVCSGQHYEPVQVSRVQADRIVESVRESVAALRVELEAVASGKVTPKTVVKGYGKNRTEIKFADAALYEQEGAVEDLKRAIAHRINAGEDFAKHLEAVANKYHGQPLTEIKLDEVGIVVGSSVKVQGSVVTVTKIEYRVARGVGPSINGQHILHVCFERNGKEYAYPKRFAKLV
jgi:hypothetical protein